MHKIEKNGVTFCRYGFTVLESGRRFDIFGVVINNNVDFKFLTIEITFEKVNISYNIEIESPILYIKSPNGKLDFLLEEPQKIYFDRKNCRDSHNNNLSYDEIISVALIEASNIWKKYMDHHRHNYMLLNRLQLDCSYYPGYDAKHNLWAGDEQEQIDKMRELYDLVPEKPDWLTEEQINKYASKMGVK